MSPLAILIISIVLINTAGKVILACIDAKNRNSRTRERTSNAKRIKHHETEEKAISDK